MDIIRDEGGWFFVFGPIWVVIIVIILYTILTSRK